MSRGVNKCIFIGNLGQEPDVRYTPNGAAVANLSIACNEQWKDKDTGEKKEHVEWVRCVAFGKLAEIIKDYVKKGSQVYVETTVRTRKWQDKEGKDRYSTEFVVGHLQMLGGRSSSDVGGARAAQQEEAYAETGAPQKQNDFDDDIPF